MYVGHFAPCKNFGILKNNVFLQTTHLLLKKLSSLTSSSKLKKFSQKKNILRQYFWGQNFTTNFFFAEPNYFKGCFQLKFSKKPYSKFICCMLPFCRSFLSNKSLLTLFLLRYVALPSLSSKPSVFCNQWRSEAKCRPGSIIKLPPFSPLKFASKYSERK